MSRAGRTRALLFWVLSIALVCVIISAAGLWAVNAFKPAPPPLSTGCTAAVGSEKYYLAPDQAANAGLITAISVRRQLPPRAASIALAVALQESKLRNITHGDMDSLGLFQQRPSQDWGTQAEILDPVFSTNSFYSELVKVPNYQTIPITEAAQAVQRSAYPDAYAQHDPLGRAFASALTGQSQGTLVCTLEAPTAAGSPSAVKKALELGYGPVESTATATTLTVPASDVTGWSYAQWAVANADSLNITDVNFSGKHWNRGDNDGTTNKGWQSAPDGADALAVVITVKAEKS